MKAFEKQKSFEVSLSTVSHQPSLRYLKMSIMHRKRGRERLKPHHAGNILQFAKLILQTTALSFNLWHTFAYLLSGQVGCLPLSDPVQKAGLIYWGGVA